MTNWIGKRVHAQVYSNDRRLLVWEDFPLCVIRQKRWKIEQAIGAMHSVHCTLYNCTVMSESYWYGRIWVILQTTWKIELAKGFMHTVQVYSDVRGFLVWEDFPDYIKHWIGKRVMHIAHCALHSDVRGFLVWEDFPLRHPGGPSLVASVSNHLASRRTITCCKQIPTKVYSLNRQLSLTFENYGNSLQKH